MENQATVISRDTVITGDIKTGSSLVIEGGINGNIDTKGVLKLSGKVIGDISANVVHLDGAEVKGSIVSGGEVTMDSESIVIGDVSGESAEISGSIKGNVDCKGFVRLTETAIINGDVIASDSEKASGAIIDGRFIHAHDNLDVKEYFDTRSKTISIDDVKIPEKKSEPLSDEEDNTELEDGGIVNMHEDFNEED